MRAKRDVDGSGTRAFGRRVFGEFDFADGPFILFRGGDPERRRCSPSASAPLDKK